MRRRPDRGAAPETERTPEVDREHAADSDLGHPRDHEHGAKPTVRSDIEATAHRYDKGSVRADIEALLKSRRVREWIIIGITAFVVHLLFVLVLMLGPRFLSPAEIVSIVLGKTTGPDAFALLELRAPRAFLGLFTGAAFGMAGTTFQTMLRNPLASPDIIGISSGASAFAVFAIIVLGASDTTVSLFALGGALVTALAIFVLSSTTGFAGFRMILIGIGFAALLNAVTQWILSGSPSWDLQTAMRWLSGSLNGATWKTVIPLAIVTVALGLVLILLRRHLDLMRLGDDTARGLGVPVTASRIALVITAVALLAVATASAGPIAFVAFMSGPVAARLLKSGRPPLFESALVGAALVLGADLIAQNAFAVHYPVGVVTGLLGAPFLIYLLIRMNKGVTKL